jgi:hypothetical protein
LKRNLVSPEPKLDYRLHELALEDPTFERCITHLLGPPLVDANKITGLSNGDERRTPTCSTPTFIFRPWHPLGKAGRKSSKARPARVGIALGSCSSSANFDSRSFRLNDEANLNAMDCKFASQQARVFAMDK